MVGPDTSLFNSEKVHSPDRYCVKMPFPNLDTNISQLFLRKTELSMFISMVKPRHAIKNQELRTLMVLSLLLTEILISSGNPTGTMDYSKDSLKTSRYTKKQ